MILTLSDNQISLFFLDSNVFEDMICVVHSLIFSIDHDNDGLKDFLMITANALFEVLENWGHASSSDTS